MSCCRKGKHLGAQFVATPELQALITVFNALSCCKTSADLSPQKLQNISNPVSSKWEVTCLQLQFNVPPNHFIKIVHWTIAESCIHMSEALLLTPLFINREKVPSSDNKTFNVVNPYSHTVVSRAASATSANCLAAIDAAHAAFKMWEHSLLQQRKDVLIKAAADEPPGSLCTAMHSRIVLGVAQMLTDLNSALVKKGQEYSIAQ
ncbi:hypothetical protein EDD85DRAFT_793310 [Armillaria nabsnona]|nr:hypothetical protein EDD85DRAFT_793310 [Armillaria nabsnona]